MVQQGDRIELVHTDDEYTSLQPGDRGTVEQIETDAPEITPSGEPEQKLWIDWDTGSSLALIVGQDEFTVLDESEE